MLNGSQTLAIGCPTNPATSLLFCCAKLLKKAWGKAPFFSMHAFHLLTSDISSSILFKRSNCQKESGQAVLVCSLSKARHIRFYPKKYLQNALPVRISHVHVFFDQNERVAL